MSKTTKYSAEVEFAEGQESDFSELHQAIKSGKVGQNEFENDDSDEGSENEALNDLESMKNALDRNNYQRPQTPPSSEEEEDETEPDVSKPGPRLLWAAQHNRIDIIEEILATDLSVIKYADEDGYTALHRAAYSGSKVISRNFCSTTNQHKCAMLRNVSQAKLIFSYRSKGRYLLCHSVWKNEKFFHQFFFS